MLHILSLDLYFSLFMKTFTSNRQIGILTIVQILYAVVNIILGPYYDLWFVVGCPEIQCKGAAYATVIGQIISLAVAFISSYKV